MHLKIFIFVTLVALGGAARQSWKSTNSEKNGNTHWKKGSNSATKSPLLNINYDYSQKKVPSQRKEVRKLESLTIESIVPKCSGILQQETRSRGTRVESDKLDLDITSARIPAGYVAVGTFDETSPMLLKRSGSYSKKPFEAIKKSKKLAEDPGSDEEWNLVQKKLKDLYNVLTVESSSLPITSGQSIQIKTRQKSLSSKSQIGASDHTARKAAEKVEPMRDSEKLVELEDCAVRSYFNLPVRETLATDGYEHSKKGMKCSSDRMADLYVDSIADRPMDVHEQGSTESSTLSARLASIEDELADLRQFLLDHELDEPVLRQN